ncbi:MAG: hypothetical protein IPO67_20885 [Deltaproteobacteria bacterium]|nr:hypothetical protein [Deltaproteobacteria bacterium]
MHTSKLVIRGERGAGKTTLFQLLGALDAQKLPLSVMFPGASLTPGRVVEGFSERGKGHPSAAALDQLAEAGDDGALRAMWFGHLVGVLSESIPAVTAPGGDFIQRWRAQRAEPLAWVGAAQAELGPLTTWLDRLDDQLSQTNAWVFVTYDHLDKLGFKSPLTRRRFASTLMAMWLSLASRYERLRCKVFLREDLFQSALRGSADASKLQSRSVTLLWSPADLYRALIRHISAAEGLRGWLIDEPKAIPLTERPPLGWFPPDPLPEDGQRQLVGKLAGEVMGEGVTKGFTHSWMMNHLQDGFGRVVPRSLFNLVRFAAEIAVKEGPKARYARLLSPDELRAALVKTSLARVNELQEEHTLVQRLESLRGMTLLGERSDFTQALRAPPARGLDDGFGDDGAAAFDELVRLGVLKLRSDGRVDVPDLYRYGFGIKRKGGVARPR